MDAAPQGEWNCPGCAVQHVTPYCGSCGEARVDSHHLSLRGFSGQLLAAISSVDSQLIRSFRLLLTRPGSLTVKYKRGERKAYLLPINLFLFANVLFFAVQSFASVKIFATPLAMHLNDQFWSPLANHLLQGRLLATGVNLGSYRPVFDQAVALNAKTLIGLMVPLFALLLPVAFIRRRQPFVVHAVFALHTYTFILVMLCAVLALFIVLTSAGFNPASSQLLDQVVSVLQLAALFVYLLAAICAVYDVRGWQRVVTALALTVFAGGVLLAYRFSLFLITLYTT